MLVDGFVRVEGRVVLRESGCDLGVVGFFVGFTGRRVLGIGGVGPVAVHELFDPLCRVLGCPLAVEGGRVDIVFSAVLVGFLFEHVVEGASGACSFGELFFEFISGRVGRCVGVRAGAFYRGFYIAEFCFDACCLFIFLSSEGFGLGDASGADSCLGCFPCCAPSMRVWVVVGHRVLDEGGEFVVEVGVVEDGFVDG